MWRLDVSLKLCRDRWTKYEVVRVCGCDLNPTSQKGWCVMVVETEKGMGMEELR